MSVLQKLKAKWHDAINLIDKNEYMMGGADGNMNQAPRQLAENALYLKKQIEGIHESFQCSKETNGYTKLPNGMMMQWGVVDFDQSPNRQSISHKLTFPQPFKTACLNLQTTRKIADAGSRYGDGGMLIESFTRTQANLTLQVYGNGDEGTDLRGFYWFAIGY